jgi:hypothetical protein
MKSADLRDAEEHSTTTPCSALPGPPTSPLHGRYNNARYQSPLQYRREGRREGERLRRRARERGVDKQRGGNRGEHGKRNLLETNGKHKEALRKHLTVVTNVMGHSLKPTTSAPLLLQANVVGEEVRGKQVHTRADAVNGASAQQQLQYSIHNSRREAATSVQGLHIRYCHLNTPSVTRKRDTSCKQWRRSNAISSATINNGKGRFREAEAGKNTQCSSRSEISVTLNSYASLIAIAVAFTVAVTAAT